jgi:hypothetical protein
LRSGEKLLGTAVRLNLSESAKDRRRSAAGERWVERIVVWRVELSGESRPEDRRDSVRTADQLTDKVH